MHSKVWVNPSFSIFTDIERVLLSERTKQWLKLARIKGEILGWFVLDPHQNPTIAF